MENLVHRKVKRAVQCHTAHMNPHFLMDSISPPPLPLFFIHTLNTKKQNFSATNRTYKVLYGNENEFFVYKLFPNCGFHVFYSYYIYLLLRSLTSVQFSSVQSVSHVRLFVTP